MNPLRYREAAEEKLRDGHLELQPVMAVRNVTSSGVGLLLLLSQILVAHAQVPAEFVPQQSERDQGLAVRHLAEAGDANAQWMVGQGLLSPPDGDPAAAFMWFLRAAEQGHPLAQRDLGLLYEAGWGVRQDLQEAYFWYSLAAVHDSGRAAVRRDEIASGLNPERRTEVERRLQSWRSHKTPAAN